MSGRRSHGGSAGGGKRGPGGGIHFQRNEPSFLTKMKEEIGYKTKTVDVQTKFTEDGATIEDRDDQDDEAPTVVVLKKGDLTAEEAAKERLKQVDKEEEDEEPPADGKIRFKQPKKRSAPEGEDKESSKASKKVQKKEVKVQKQLLSFGDDEEEDEWMMV